MPNEIKNITNEIMDKIHNEKIKMKPRTYFVIGSILTFVGLVSSVVFSVFLIGLMKFSIRSHGPMANYRFDKIMDTFPWWALILAVVGLFIGVWLIRKYDFSFKVNLKFFIIGFIFAVFIGGWIVDSMGFNEALMRRGPMRGMMKQYMQDSGINYLEKDGGAWTKNRFK